MQGDIGENNNHDHYTYWMFRVAEEPKVIVKVCCVNGLESWRSLKSQYDSASEVTQVRTILRALLPPNISDMRSLLPSVDRWEEGL